MKQTINNLLAALIMMLTAATFAGAATLTVTNTADSGAGSLRGQIAAAAAGDTIVFDPTVFASAQTINTSSALAISKTLTITGTGARLLTVRRNVATNFAVFNVSAGTVRVSGITVSNGSNQAGGGSAFNTPGAAILTLDSIAATGNAGTESAVGGFSGTITITNSLISNNNSVVGVIAEGTINIANSTISGNNGTSVGLAGGVVSVGTVNLNNVTVANNINGGIENTSIINIRNTIVTGSTVRADTLGAFVSQGNNLISNRGTATGFTQPTDKLNVAANIAALANNGGQTDSFLPNAGSPAIDAGNNCVVTATCGTNNPPAALTTDQRGNYVRQRGTAVDIGAVEYLAPTAAGVSISGRVLVGAGRGLVNAAIYLTDANGRTRSVQTSAFGYYRFNDIAAGQTIIVTVVSKRYQFAPQVVSLTDALSEINFVALP